MADPAQPVLDQPSAAPVAADPDQVPDVQEDAKIEGGGVAKSTSWWGVSNLTSYLTDPALLEQSINTMASNVAQATSGATKMVKSKSMEVMKAVTEDLSEVKETLGQYATPLSKAVAPIKGAGTSIKNSIKELDEVTDDMAENAINGVAKGASSLWNFASGYASQMFTEEDLEATPVLVGTSHEPIILDRLQAQLHALGSDQGTYTADPDPGDSLAEDWVGWLAELDLDRRQGEISELMINNTNIRKHYSSLVPGTVQHKLFWARYFYKVHLIEKLEVKRQVLKKRAEQTKADSDNEINWDDDDDLETVEEIPVLLDRIDGNAVQEKLLTEYEAELKTKKPSHAKKDSNASDDWEKLSNESK
eukprot:GFUD01077013.1.p1 GENE.GFUD01077013.1~~GFUD01077013.1.p1  ORF type:complete len:362 (+),score=133.80 GFUD01077013.1:53-1138(+)